MGILSSSLQPPGVWMHLSHKQLRVLFFYTHNSTRSQMTGRILCQLSKGNIVVFGTGSTPPSAHSLTQQGANYMREFKGQYFDYIVTGCDRMHETCPTFPGDPEQNHWSFPDPTVVQASEQQGCRAFKQVALQLAKRIRYWLILSERIYRKMGEKQE